LSDLIFVSHILFWGYEWAKLVDGVVCVCAGHFFLGLLIKWQQTFVFCVVAERGEPGPAMDLVTLRGVWFVMQIAQP